MQAVRPTVAADSFHLMPTPSRIFERPSVTSLGMQPAGPAKLPLFRERKPSRGGVNRLLSFKSSNKNSDDTNGSQANIFRNLSICKIVIHWVTRLLTTGQDRGSEKLWRRTLAKLRFNKKLG